MARISLSGIRVIRVFRGQSHFHLMSRLPHVVILCPKEFKFTDHDASVERPFLAEVADLQTVWLDYEAPLPMSVTEPATLPPNSLTFGLLAHLPFAGRCRSFAESCCSIIMRRT